MKKLHVVYIPGLGDDNIARQSKAISTWRWWNVDAELFQMNWSDSQPWAKKFERLLARIDTLDTAQVPVALVGVSAGGSAVINAYAARKHKLVGVVCISGKVNRPNKIGPRYLRQNPSFVESARQAPDSLDRLDADDRKRILSRYAPLDLVVAQADSHISGARNRLSPTIGHIFTIAFQITLGAPSFLRFLKHLLSERHADA